MHKIYHRIDNIAGSVLTLRAEGVSYHELAEVTSRMRANHGGMIDCADLLRANAEAGREKRPHCDALVYEAVGLVEELLEAAGR